jgi:hypothetical protein
LLLCPLSHQIPRSVLGAKLALAIIPKHPAPTPKSDQIDDYHGSTVANPYRWLEDASDPDVQFWIKAHNQRMRAYLDQLPALEKNHSTPSAHSKKFIAEVF